MRALSVSSLAHHIIIWFVTCPADSITCSLPIDHVEPLKVVTTQIIPEATLAPVSFCQIVRYLPVPISHVLLIYAPSAPDVVSIT